MAQLLAFSATFIARLSSTEAGIVLLASAQGARLNCKRSSPNMVQTCQNKHIIQYQIVSESEMSPHSHHLCLGSPACRACAWLVSPRPVHTGGRQLRESCSFRCALCCCFTGSRTWLRHGHAALSSAHPLTSQRAPGAAKGNTGTTWQTCADVGLAARANLSILMLGEYLAQDSVFVQPCPGYFDLFF